MNKKNDVKDMSILKTSTEKISEPDLSLIVLGVLKGYINNPIFFILKTKISFKNFKKKIKLDLPEDFISSSAFIAWLYICLKKKINKDKAFEIVRSAIITSGIAVQQANFRTVEENRNFRNLIKYQQKTNKEGSTRLNTMDIIEQSETKYVFKVTRCLFYEIFSYLDVPELTSIMCSIDNAIFNTYLPEKIIFHRNGLNNTMVFGKDHCDFVIENRETPGTALNC